MKTLILFFFLSACSSGTVSKNEVKKSKYETKKTYHLEVGLKVHEFKTSKGVDCISTTLWDESIAISCNWRNH